MKHISYFTEFLKDEVNLNQTRLDLLEQRVDTISTFLEASDLLNEFYIDVFPQGSYAHKTIIKPFTDKEFDADIILRLEAIEGWEPKDYINNIYHLFKNSKTYKDMVSRGTRCIVITYAKEFHLDIVPCIVIEGKHYIMNRIDNVLEETDGVGFENWFAGKNKITGSNYLIKAVRLIKYIRNIKQTFSAKSVLLATLLASQIDENEDSDSFTDVPTSLQIIINRLNDFLQNNPDMPEITNPVLSTESFNRHWDQDKYENFRSKIKDYNDKINAAMDESSKNESIKKWRKIFGDDFGILEENVAKKNINIIRDYEPASPWLNNDK